MNIILITPQNRSQYLAEMDAAYALRDRVFNTLMKWGLPVQNGLEIDCFDVRANHLLAIETDGTVVGTWRLMPTSSTYMAEVVFPDLFKKTGAINSPEVWELSRFAVDGEYYGKDKEAFYRMGGALTAAVMEFCIMNGVAELLSIQNRLIARVANRYLGAPVWQSETLDAGITTATCYSYAPSLERLYSLRAQFELPSPVMSQYQLEGTKLAA